MPHTSIRPTRTFDQDCLHQTCAVIPEAFADSKSDWDSLREVLGEHMEGETVEYS
jgi:hypothetical protein